jgi:hypothetical protein
MVARRIRASWVTCSVGIENANPAQHLSCPLPKALIAPAPSLEFSCGPRISAMAGEQEIESRLPTPPFRARRSKE